MIVKPTLVKALKPYLIWLKYEDDTEGQVDLSNLTNQPVFEKWVNPEFYNSVHINSETHAIAWDEDIELCPFTLYLKIKGLSFEQWKSIQNNYATSK